jgi:Domain of unknown function (DUF4410)
MMFHSCRTAILAAGMLVLTSLTGCATTVPTADFSQQIVAGARVSAPDTVKVNVDAADAVKMLPIDKERIAEEVAMKIDARKAANATAGAARVYEVDLRLTRYDKGNAFARAMLAGLGQIHIEGVVSVFEMPGHTAVGEFTLKKTFAWGGIYGAATSIEDIEDTFADGVAAAVTGQKEAPPKQKT